MKRIFVLIFALFVLLTSCREREELLENFIKQPTVDENYYADEAIKLTLEASSLAASDEVVGMYTSDEDVLSIIKSIADFDFSKPESVQIVKIDTDKIKEYLSELYPEETASFNIEKLLELNRIRISAFAQTYNSTFGVDYIAALSLLSGVGEGYVMPANYEDDFVIYLKYPGEFSSIVEFRKIGENVISSTMQFVKNPEDGQNAEDFMSEIFDAIGKDSITVETVEKEA